jgi:hypothetical protein
MSTWSTGCRALAAAALGAAVLAGGLPACSGTAGDGDAGSGSTAGPDTDFGTPATGPELVGDGYTLHAPEGWQDTTESSREVQREVDTAASAPMTGRGLAPNLNVGFDRAPGATLETLEASIPGQLEEMVTDLEQLDRVVVDGVEMLHHRGPVEAAGTRYVLEQLVTVDDSGRVTIVSFSFPRSSTQQDRDAVVGPVLASWRWTG